MANNSSPYTLSERLLLLAQQPVTGPHLEPDKFSQIPHPIALRSTSHVLPCVGIQNIFLTVPSLQVLFSENFKQASISQCVLHVPPTHHTHDRRHGEE